MKIPYPWVSEALVADADKKMAWQVEVSPRNGTFRSNPPNYSLNWMPSLRLFPVVAKGSLSSDDIATRTTLISASRRNLR
jgi:hypothetical protein